MLQEYILLCSYREIRFLEESPTLLDSHKTQRTNLCLLTLEITFERSIVLIIMFVTMKLKRS